MHRTPAIQHGGDSFIEGYSSDDEVYLRLLRSLSLSHEKALKFVFVD